ncbi:membrane protein YqaA, SNARE-associated domain [Flavobacterium segetis]|uniref:Membrane protein YqaA, SNARE-associated domain n=1 Tax=Flavobacterium segetis TaxID=271157 RepID=A0A1M5J2N0_9FLAO|nr:YqaA family protein [Flavobacterium segetis]SHG34867.1 membrane protein YqaA, SNARE-associated domain [Flavobacterium segetis]
MNWIRNLYDWVLSWAQTKYGASVLFILAFTESIFFPIPPDILLIALALGASSKAFKYALICTLGSVSGAFICYGIGNYAWLNSSGEFSAFANFFFDTIPGFSVALYDGIKNLFVEWDFWVIFTAGFTPIPYKVFTITAGAFNINLAMFALASIVSRGARFFIIAWLIWKYGASIKLFIEKYFNLLALVATVVLIGGFVLIKYVI